MSIEEIRYFLSHLDTIQQADDLEEELRDLTVTVDVSNQGCSTTGAILSNVLNYPEIVGDCSVDIDSEERSEHLFRITSRGVDLSADAFEEIEDGTSVNGASYRTELSSHINEDREHELIYGLVSLLHEIEAETSYEVDCSILINKARILNIWIDSQDHWEVDPDRLNTQFWYDLENLNEWLEDSILSDYASEMFISDEMPVLVYYRDGTSTEHSGTDHFPIFELTDTTGRLSRQFDTYRDKITATRNNTSYLNEAPIVSPSLFADSESLQQLFDEAFLYSMFAVFSDRVVVDGTEFRFSAEYGPHTIDEEPVDIKEIVSNLDTHELKELAGLYLDFSRREDRPKFVEFWRQSMLQNCDSVTELVEKIDDIRMSYEFIEGEVIEQNFDELSDAIRDTNAFMTEITGQVSETTTALSDEIQRLVFALLGAIIANLFLILRWSNFDTVIPFSLFVISAMLVFYFPLIDRRIEELDEMKSKGEKDYETYKGVISDFTGQAFNFDELELRKTDYMEYADERLQWSRLKLRQLHGILLVTGLIFVFLANFQYSPDSVQVAFSLIFIFTSIYIAVNAFRDPTNYSYYHWKTSGTSGDENGQEVSDEVADPDPKMNPIPIGVSVIAVLVIVGHLVAVTAPSIL